MRPPLSVLFLLTATKLAFCEKVVGEVIGEVIGEDVGKGVGEAFGEDVDDFFPRLPELPDPKGSSDEQVNRIEMKCRGREEEKLFGDILKLFTDHFNCEKGPAISSLLENIRRRVREIESRRGMGRGTVKKRRKKKKRRIL
jgi:hypothetical protein